VGLDVSVCVLSLASISIGVRVEPFHQSRHRNLKHRANSQQRPKSDWPPLFNLLPMSRREPKRDHVLLAVALLYPQIADSQTKCAKELLLRLRHASVCKVSRAKSPRAD